MELRGEHACLARFSAERDVEEGCQWLQVNRMAADVEELGLERRRERRRASGEEEAGGRGRDAPNTPTTLSAASAQSAHAPSSNGQIDSQMWAACLLDAPSHPSAIPLALHQRPEAQAYSIRSVADGRLVGFVCVAGNSPGDLRTGIDILVPAARLGDKEVSEAVLMAVDHIFSQGYRRIETEVWGDAHALRQLLIDLGAPPKPS
ncbi:hypothetical protein T484DRAFT_1861467 [Baffinella frigidus]|nr:hypothetical protein T484DRAFT_1861467 [Cryptophyta sp. CCMP2293]